MKRLAMLLVMAGAAMAAGPSQPATPGFTWDQFLQWIQPNPNPPQRIVFSGPAWIWEMVDPLPLTLEEKVLLANQVWVSFILSSH